MIEDQEFYELKRRVAELERIIQHMSPDVPPPPPQPQVDPEILRLIREDKKIQAIKLYREQTGAGLAEAKMAVEDIESMGFRLS
jgi:ribosomal protein L7/L12